MSNTRTSPKTKDTATQAKTADQIYLDNNPIYSRAEIERLCFLSEKRKKNSALKTTSQTSDSTSQLPEKHDISTQTKSELDAYLDENPIYRR
jgi:hypothetical protein